METTKHAYHYEDYSYLRPTADHVGMKMPDQVFTMDTKGKVLYRNLYYGVQIPPEQHAQTVEFNTFLQKELDAGNIKKLPDFWSFHDSYRFADAAGYNMQGATRDVVEHSPWIEELKEFNLTPEGADILKKGNIYIFGRDKNGYANLVINIKNLNTYADGIPHIRNAMTFIMAVFKKWAMLPYHCE